MKKINFNLALTFTGDVHPKQLNQIMENVARAIINEANHGQGIIPEDAEYVTEEVELSHINIADRVRHRVY